MTLLFLFICSLAAPAVAERDDRFRHEVSYRIGGRIRIDRELGHPCFTGAFVNQTVRGEGELTKSEVVRIAPHIMSIEGEMDWTAFSDALRNMIVTTTIDLCARPMTTANFTYPRTTEDLIYAGLTDFIVRPGQIISPYHPLVVEGLIDVTALTSQDWNTRLVTFPGEEGSYHLDFIAAYGPGPREEMGIRATTGEVVYFPEEFRWWYDPPLDRLISAEVMRGLTEDDIDRGEYYVGNYFEIDQYAYTSGGELSRRISMSSPFFETYLRESLFVRGMAEVKDEFEMENLEPGPRGVRLTWWELF